VSSWTLLREALSTAVSSEAASNAKDSKVGAEPEATDLAIGNAPSRGFNKWEYLPCAGSTITAISMSTRSPVTAAFRDMTGCAQSWTSYVLSRRPYVSGSKSRGSRGVSCLRNRVPIYVFLCHSFSCC